MTAFLTTIFINWHSIASPNVLLIIVLFCLNAKLCRNLSHILWLVIASKRRNPGVKILDLSGISVFISHPCNQWLIVLSWIATLRSSGFVQFNSSSIIAFHSFYYSSATRLLAMTDRVASCYRNLFHRYG